MATNKETIVQPSKSKYGAPSAGAPKVFVKYFYVNTATGEKSGEMLGVATLSSSEEDGD